MNKRTLIVMGLFWILLVSFVAAGSVAADGMYWGDSTDPDEPGNNGNHHGAGNGNGNHHGAGNGNNCNNSDDVDIFITSGMYWGD